MMPKTRSKASQERCSGAEVKLSEASAGAPAGLKWDPGAGVNTGQLLIPEQAIPGTYKLTVTAEDIAHNTGSQGVEIEIVP